MSGTYGQHLVQITTAGSLPDIYKREEESEMADPLTFDPSMHFLYTPYAIRNHHIFIFLFTISSLYSSTKLRRAEKAGLVHRGPLLP